MSSIITELLSDINSNKVNLPRLDDSIAEKYPTFVILKCLNGLDTILVVNEINTRSNIPTVRIHDFLIAIIPKKRRYNKWLKKIANPDVELIMEFYNINRTKALDAMNILTPEQLTEIKNRLEKNDNSSITRKKNS